MTVEEPIPAMEHQATFEVQVVDVDGSNIDTTVYLVCSCGQMDVVEVVTLTEANLAWQRHFSALMEERQARAAQ